MKIKDLTTGEIFKYGSKRHHALRISDDGKTLSFENLQNGDGSAFGNYRFIDDSEEVLPEETDSFCHGADSYFNIGGFGIYLEKEDMYDKTIEIVNQLAEKMNLSENLTSSETVITNADKIRAMTDEELAEFLDDLTDNCCRCAEHQNCGNCQIGLDVKTGFCDIKKWLQSEAE